jgi:hypothetical protein
MANQTKTFGQEKTKQTHHKTIVHFRRDCTVTTTTTKQKIESVELPNSRSLLSNVNGISIIPMCGGYSTNFIRRISKKRKKNK